MSERTQAHAAPAPFLWAAGLCWGLFVVWRPVAFQQLPYSLEAGFANLLALLLAACAWRASRDCARSSMPPVALCWLGGLAVGMLVWGMVRSPHDGKAFARLGEFGIAFSILLSVYALVRTRPGAAGGLLAAWVAMGLSEAIIGVWQYHVDLPILRARIAAGLEAVPDELQSMAGRWRLQGDDCFGTFGISNTLAAYLLPVLFVHAALWRAGRRAREVDQGRWRRSDACHAALLVLLGYAFYLTGSKGAWAAAGFGAWIWFAQSYATSAPRRRWFTILTVTGVGASLTVACLVVAGVIPPDLLGASMLERFGYWQTGAQMLAAEPWMGLGLGSFGEAFSIFKVPLATEAQEAHNDWLQLWIELGVLGPLAYAAFWWWVLRSPAASEEGGVAPQESLSQAPLFGAGLAFLVAWLAFGHLGGDHFADLLAPDAVEIAPASVWGAAGGLLAAIVWGCGWWAHQSAPAALNRPELGHGLRAGMGALLAHQAVDFDHAAPGVLCALFAGAGLLLARRPAAPAADARWPRAVFAIGILVLLPVAVVVPLQSGSSRQLAEILDQNWRREAADLARQAGPAADREERAREIVHTQELAVLEAERAWRWAPFDGEAADAVARGYAGLRETGQTSWQPPDADSPRSVDTLCADAWLDAEALRPWYAGAPLQLGLLAFERGWAAPAGLAKLGSFGEAEAHFLRAARLYPLAPALRVHAGDARLWCGDANGAAAHYRLAWETDRRIRDWNTAFLSLFWDTRPGAATRHGHDMELLPLLRASLNAPGLSEAERTGLRMRIVLVHANAIWRIRAGALGDSTAVRRAGEELLESCRILSAGAPEDPHAALFEAVAVVLFRRKEPEAGRAALQHAREARAAAEQSGRPATPERFWREVVHSLEIVLQEQ
ncbi:MAG: O-antigen ligase family protein [Planctomycetes bacterium]|nr:O-antigen ligase family protein [Planctomycetota bacterium]